MTGNDLFGNLGDVWKHLLLSEILREVSVDRYWGTHAGAARYEMDDATPRRYGIERYLAVSDTDPTLETAAFTETLAAHRAVPSWYLGSPALAIRLTDANCYFFDVNPACLDSIRAEAARENSGDRVSVVPADGLAGVDAGLAAASIDGRAGTSRADENTQSANGGDGTSPEQSRTVVHIDPFKPYIGTETARHSPVELFARAGNDGVVAVLWYGFSTRQTADTRWERVATDLREQLDDSATVWCGETCLSEQTASAVDTKLVGSHLICVNLPAETRDRCVELGRAFTDAYSGRVPARESSPTTVDGGAPTLDLSFTVRSVE